MLSGTSSDFINSVSEFVNKNNKPLSVTLISDEMSRSFYDVLGFEPMDNLVTGVGFHKMKRVGGINTFFSTEKSIEINAIADLSLYSFISTAASSGILNLIPGTRTVDESASFAVKMPENHVSSVFFGMNPTRPGYIIDTGDDPDDIFELDENRGNMIVYVNELSVGSNLYYHFFPQDGFYMRNTGIYGLGVEITKRENLSDDVIMI